MTKTAILTVITLFLLSGCVQREPTPTQQVIGNSSTLKCHQFANQKLCATPNVSNLVNQIEPLIGSNGIDLNYIPHQNMRLNSLFKLEARPNSDGYLKLILINPNGERTTLLPNNFSDGKIRANQAFSTNNPDFAIKTTPPRGLHYLIVTFTKAKVPLQVTQGFREVYNGVDNNQDFINILTAIKNRTYGDSYISIFPLNIY